jgi:hypothetical protein
MAKSYYGPGSTGVSVPVQAQGWQGGYGGPQQSGAAGAMGWSVAPALGGVGFDPATNRQTNRAVDPNAGGGMFGPAQGGMGGDPLAASRAQAFGSLAQGSSIFRGSLGNAVGQNLEQRVGGFQQPYDQGTQDRMFAAAADQSNAAAGAQEQRMRDFFANSGTGGSGAQLGGLLDTATAHDQRMQAARSDITNRAQLENFGARERAANDASAFMGAQSAGEAPYRLKEADLLSGDEVTNQQGDPQMAALLRLLGGGQQRQGIMGPIDNGFRSSGQVQAQRPSMSSTSRTSRPASPAASPASASAPAARFNPIVNPLAGPSAFGGYAGGAQTSMDSYFAQANPLGSVVPAPGWTPWEGNSYAGYGAQGPVPDMGEPPTLYGDPINNLPTTTTSGSDFNPGTTRYPTGDYGQQAPQSWFTPQAGPDYSGYGSLRTPATQTGSYGQTPAPSWFTPQIGPSYQGYGSLQAPPTQTGTYGQVPPQSWFTPKNSSLTPFYQGF